MALNNDYIPAWRIFSDDDEGYFVGGPLVIASPTTDLWRRTIPPSTDYLQITRELIGGGACP